jgi:hypothetical protein
MRFAFVVFLTSGRKRRLSLIAKAVCKNRASMIKVGARQHCHAQGKYRRTRVFVMRLGYSRKGHSCWRFPQFGYLGRAARESLPSTCWPFAHHRANYLAGEVRLRCYFNPRYRDVLAHYGAKGLPCWTQASDRKARRAKSAVQPKSQNGLLFTPDLSPTATATHLSTISSGISGA